MTSPDVLGNADPAGGADRTGSPGKARRGGWLRRAGRNRAADAVPALANGRNLELVLLAFAAVIVTGALALVEANQEEDLTRAVLYVGAAYLALFAIAHFAVRKLAPYADPLVLPCVALLNGLGLVMIHRLDLAAHDRALAQRRDAPTELIQRQVAWTAIGLVLFVAVLFFVRNHRTVRSYGYTAGFVGLVLLALPGLLPSSVSEVNGAKIWLRLGIFSIQPGEFAKIALIAFFSRYLLRWRDLREDFGTNRRRRIPPMRLLAPLLIAWGLSVVVLVLEHDLGTSLLFFGIVLVLLYTATNQVSWLVIGLVLFTGGGFVAYQLFGHVRTRVQVWLDPFADFNGSGYQIGQALFGLGTGGVGGTGLGAGRPDLVPYAESDFMLSSLGEELGLVGLAAILVVYLVLITRGLRSALAVRDNFGKLLATGLAFTLALQTFIVAGGVTRLIPLTGLTLPFLSYGGSSLVANYVLVALLLRVSDAARRPLPSGPGATLKPIGEARTELVERPS